MTTILSIFEQMKSLLLYLFITSSFFGYSQRELSTKAKILDLYLEYKFEHPEVKFRKFLFVSINNQQMHYIVRKKVKKTYAISSAKFGVSCVEGSNCTPIGLHKIDQKFGDTTPKNGIIKDRVYTGKIATVTTDSTDTENDYVTSRILWLRGLETGKNTGAGVDSYNRYIYIHGTAEEGLIGKPASHGCIRMYNDDVIELYQMVATGIPVIILQN